MLALFILCSIEGNYAQSLTLPSNGYTNTIGSAISGGLFIDKDAIFYGFSIDYSKVILQNWIVNISFAYDKEMNTQTKQDIPDINSYTPSIALGYAFNQKTAIGIGLGKSIFDDDNEDKKIQFIQLIPIDTNSEVGSMLLGIDVDQKRIYKLIETGKDGVITTFKISKFGVNSPISENLFKFDKNHYEELDYIINQS